MEYWGLGASAQIRIPLLLTYGSFNGPAHMQAKPHRHMEARHTRDQVGTARVALQGF